MRNAKERVAAVPEVAAVTVAVEPAGEQSGSVSDPMHAVEAAKPVAVDPLPWLVQRLLKKDRA